MPFRLMFQSDKAMRILRIFEGWSLALLLPVLGALVGYAYSQNRLQGVVAQLNQEHTAELSRIANTNVAVENSTKQLLGAIQQQVTRVAEQTSSTEKKAGDAANAATAAASQAGAAADAAKTTAATVKQQRLKPVVIEKPVPVPVPASAVVSTEQRAHLRQTIEQTNSRIKGQ